MFHKSKLLLILAALMMFSCDDQPETDTLVNAFINVDFDQVTTSSALLNIDSRQNNVVAYIVTPAIRLDELDFDEMTVIEKHNFIKDTGEVINQVPHEFKGLTQKTDYVIGAMGLDKAGNVVTAPVIVNFTTTFLTMQTNASYEAIESGGYKFIAEITPDSETAYYNYIFDTDNFELSNDKLTELLTSNSSNVKRGEGNQTFSFEKPQQATAILAAIPYDHAGVPGDVIVALISSQYLVNYDGVKILDQPDLSKKIYETTFHAPVAEEFTITIDSEQYGFFPYSGNGGIGKTGLFSAYPSFNVHNTPVNYSVSKSIGRMSKLSEGGEKFFINTSSTVEVLIRVDMTNSDGMLRYYFEIVENDPSVILHENFDLFAYSGDYMAPANGTEVELNPDVIDGTESGVKQVYDLTNAAGANKNEIAYNRNVFDWPTLMTPSNESRFLAAEEYIKNRGMEDWTIHACGERPGAIQLGVGGNLYGILTTPKLTNITGTSDIVLEIDMARFSGSSNKLIAIDIIGGGQYTAGEVTVDGKDKRVLDVSGSQFLVNADADICPPSVSNAAIDKPVSHFKFNISGATSDTQIRIDASVDGNGRDDSSRTRAFVFDIKVTK